MTPEMRNGRGGRHTILATTEAVLSVPVGETAEETAAACVDALVSLYGPKASKEALRMAVRALPRQAPGRPRDHDLSVADVTLMREYRVLLRAGMSPTEAKASVARRFSGKMDVSGRERPYRTIHDRLRRLLLPPAQPRANTPD